MAPSPTQGHAANIKPPIDSVGTIPLRQGLSVTRHDHIRASLAAAAPPFATPARRQYGGHVSLSRVALGLSVDEPRSRTAATGLREEAVLQGGGK